MALQTDYKRYKEPLRWDFWFSCAYCSIAETEARGIRFTIDHYLPQIRYPELDCAYDNLMWACDHCNSTKGDGPTEAAALRGCRHYRPDFDDPWDHFRLSASSPTRVEHVSENIGRYTIASLNLNRLTLRRLREIRASLEASEKVIVQGVNALRRIPLQNLPALTRARFVAIRDRLLSAGAKANEILDEHVYREMNRSELLDRPAESDHDAVERRKYLASVNASFPKASLASGED